MNLTADMGIDRDALRDAWFRRIAATYPRVMESFLTAVQDRFRNPVGHAIAAAVDPILEQVATDMDERALGGALDELLKIRSVQDFSPSRAVGFVFALKHAIRELAGPSADPEKLRAIDDRIDRVALMAFDCYSHHRERMHDIRANEMRARTMRLLERAGAKPVAMAHEEAPGEDATKGGTTE
jgi:hypothetical protein